MDINTGRSHEESEEAQSVVVPPDKRRPARKKAGQKLQRNRHFASRLLAFCRLLAYGAAVVLAVSAGSLAYRYANASDAFAVRGIDVVGCKHLQPADVEKAVRQHIPGSLLRVDLAQLRERLEKEPWIRRCEIRRVLPSRLKIYIEERTPSVIAEIGGALELLDRNGILLDAYDSSYGKLDVPVFSGLSGDSASAYAAHQAENSSRVRVGVQLLTELAQGSSDLTRMISEIDLSDPDNVKIMLVDDTAEIYLGDRDFLKRFQALMERYDDAKAQYGEMTSVNLRYFPEIIYNPKNPPNVKPESKQANRPAVRN